jgi:tRNA1(Val) A37 N6-methylase TrmN6
MQEQKPLPYTKPVIDLTAGYAFFDGLVIKCGSLKYLDLDSTCPVIPEEQIFVCRQMTDSILELQKSKKEGLSVLDVGTGSGVLAIYADRILNSSEFIDLPDRGISTVKVLDCSQVALNTAKENAEINQSIKIELLPKQDYKENLACLDSLCITPNSQDIILMNPPFNPTPDDLLEKVATLGSTNGFCIGKFVEWIKIAKFHLRPGGLIIGCVLSPVDCDGNVLAVEELKKNLECESGVRYININNGTHPTRNFLDEQYANYIALVSKDEQDKLSNWIEESSNTYPKLAFIYFEASDTDQICKGELTVDPRFEGQYIRDWKHRIFLHSILILSTVRKMKDPLAEIDFAKAEDTIRQLKSKNKGDIDDSLSLNVIQPIARYIRTKINSHYNLKSSKYLNEYIKNSLFLELVLFCPDDIELQPELFSFALILPLSNSSITEESANEFFNHYYSLLDFLYTRESSIFFSKDFFNTANSDQWLPKHNNLIRDECPIISKDDHLISFSNEIENNIDIGVKNIPDLERRLPISSSGQSSNKIYFCSDSGYAGKISKTAQENDVLNAYKKAHHGLEKLSGFEENKTFMVVVPIYTRTNQREGYTVTGGFLLYGEFSDFVSINEHKDEIRRMLRDFSLDLKQDFTPVIAGYASKWRQAIL